MLGFAAYGYFGGAGVWPRDRDTIEHTVHVDARTWSRGVGRARLAQLIDRARAAGKHVMVGAIDSENEASLRFPRAIGFDEVARMPQIGQKFGRWLDLVLVQRVIDDRPAP